MDKTKVLTQKDIDLLYSENWLTKNQQDHYDLYEKRMVSFSQIQKICPDETILDFIFNPKPLEFSDIQYIVNLQQYGDTFIKGTFYYVTDACNYKEKLQEENPNCNFFIAVTYKIKGK